MERSRRSHKLEPSVQDSGPDQPSRHGRHENAYQAHARDRSTGNTNKPQALIDRDHRELSGDNEYVRMWLAQMKDERESEEKMEASFKTGLDMVEVTNERHDFPLSAQKNDEQLLGSYTRPKLKRNHSTDSSLLYALPKPATEHESPVIYDANHAAQISEAPRASKRRKDETSQDLHSSISGPSQVQVDSKAFEKRARHRTREDKYEPKKKQSKKPNPEKPTRKRRGKKGDQKQAARKASESLKDNFNSNKIGQERLTIGALYYWTGDFQEWKSFIANEAEGM
ncbi:hypothetical protein CJF32_00000071 [Rutstroemia sp. NJR-2017a WRK4]|nr:hypothetical protein CJF32_00000071 [Rutstroemia sp. NJR-2017a WRK4]